MTTQTPTPQPKPDAEELYWQSVSLELLYSLADSLLKTAKVNPFTLVIETSDLQEEGHSNPPKSRSVARVMQDARKALDDIATQADHAYDEMVSKQTASDR